MEVNIRFQYGHCKNEVSDPDHIRAWQSLGVRLIWALTGETTLIRRLRKALATNCCIGTKACIAGPIRKS